jgi:hypothetical protein
MSSSLRSHLLMSNRWPIKSSHSAKHNITKLSSIWFTSITSVSMKTKASSASINKIKSFISFAKITGTHFRIRSNSSLTYIKN